MTKEGAPEEGINLAMQTSEGAKEFASSPVAGRRTSEETAVVRRTLSYPYERPKHSYLFRDGTEHELRTKSFDGLHFVLAIGSNAAPSQLLRKYGSDVEIPVVAVETHGLDVVYAGIMSNYGSIPATVAQSEGTVIRMHATLLTNDQLRRMHETEGGYYFCRLVEGKGARVIFDGVEVRTVYCYVARNGALCNDEVMGLAEIAARNRIYRTRTQREVQMLVKGLSGRGEDVEEFIVRNVESKERRDEVMKRMKGTESLDECFELVVDIGSVITSIT